MDDPIRYVGSRTQPRSLTIFRCVPEDFYHEHNQNYGYDSCLGGAVGHCLKIFPRNVQITFSDIVMSNHRARPREDRATFRGSGRFFFHFLLAHRRCVVLQ